MSSGHLAKLSTVLCLNHGIRDVEGAVAISSVNVCVHLVDCEGLPVITTPRPDHFRPGKWSQCVREHVLAQCSLNLAV